MNYYPFHIGDFAAHTSHLTWEEDIAYRRMLDWYYLNEKALPGDPAKVARLIRMPKSRVAIDAVLAEFFDLAGDGYHNKRADAELTLMAAKQEQQSTRDAHEAERMRRFRERRAQMFEALRAVNVVPAWDVSTKELQRLFDANCNAPEMHLQREQGHTCNADATAIPTPTPTPTPNKPPTPKGGVDNGFEKFWDPYPRKTAKVQAQKAWAKLQPSEALQAQILAALAVQKQSEQWTKDGGAFIPHASTWLNQRRWEDQPVAGLNVVKVDRWAGAL